MVTHLWKALLGYLSAAWDKDGMATLGEILGPNVIAWMKSKRLVSCRMNLHGKMVYGQEKHVIRGYLVCYV